MESAVETSMSKENLLPNDFQDDDEMHSNYHGLKGRRKDSFAFKSMFALIIILSASNIFLLLRNQDAKSVEKSTPEASRFAGLLYDTPTTYHNYTDYINPDLEISSKLWDDIDTSPLLVALTDEWATEHDIAVSVFRFPWDESAKGMYFLKAYHGLHCLKAMRKAFVDFEQGNPQQIASWHIYHCFDALRQDMMCNADDTPMPMTDLPNKVGNNQVRMCRSFDKLIQWSQSLERNACYHRWSDYKVVKNKIEMFAFCPEESEYYPLQQAYFEKWGHKPLYGEDEKRSEDM